MTNAEEAQTYETRLQEQLNARMTTGRELAAAAAHRAKQQAALDAAEGAYATAYATALGAGWTTSELHKAGLPASDKRGARVAPRDRVRPVATAPRQRTRPLAPEAPQGNMPAADPVPQ
jgi:hypothetical protein